MEIVESIRAGIGLWERQSAGGERRAVIASRGSPNAPDSSPFDRTRASILLLAGLLLTCCGGDRTDGVTSTLVGGHEFESGLELNVSPGTIRGRQSDEPTVWLAAPGASLTLRSDDEAPPETRFEVANLGPKASLVPETVRRLSSSETSLCPDRSAETSECEQSEAEACRAASVERDSETSTTANVTVDLPRCREVEYAVQRPPPSGSSVRIAVLGPSDATEEIRGAAEIAAEASARLLVLSGDHVQRSNEDHLDRLAEATHGLPVPVVLLPGEKETVDGSLNEIHERFGPSELDWRTTLESEGGEPTESFHTLTFETQRQRLASGGPDELRNRLDRLGRNWPMLALTHTPPVDPNALRDRGFRSDLEGTRTTSVLADSPVDLLLSGHLQTWEETRQNGFRLMSAGPDVRLLDVAKNESGRLEVEVTRREL